MELDLLAFPTRPRPTTFAEQTYESLDLIHGPGLKPKSEKMVNMTMKPLMHELAKDRAARNRLEKQKRACEDVPDRWFTDLWPLNPVTCVDWREGNRLQNSGREWTKYATFTIVEMAITETYRQELLNTSVAAAFLRSTFQDMMDPLCEKRVFESFEIPRETFELSGWCYPDPYETPQSTSVPDINLANVIAIRESCRAEAEERKKFMAWMVKAQAMRMFMATLTSDCLDDSVKLAFEALEPVSLFYGLLTYLCLLNQSTGSA